MPELIELQPDQTLEGLLAAVAGGSEHEVLLWVPRGNSLLRQMESYQALKEAAKRGGRQIKLFSPDARVVGMAMVFGLEAETMAVMPDPAALPTRRTGDMRAARAPRIAEAAPAPETVAQTQVADAAPPSPVAALTPAALPEPYEPPDSDWLFSGDLDLDSIVAEEDESGGRSSRPPSDVMLAGPSAAYQTAPPPSTSAAPAGAGQQAAHPADADIDWLLADVDVEALAGESLNPAAGAAPPELGLGVVPAPAPPELFVPPIAPEPEFEFDDVAAFDPANLGGPTSSGSSPATPELFVPPIAPEPEFEFADVAAFDPSELGDVTPFTLEADTAGMAPAASGGLSSLMGGGAEKAEQSMSFDEWLASQKAEAAGPPPDLDLSNLPDWLRRRMANEAAAQSPPPPVAAPSPPVAAPPSAPAPNALRCPHCGKDLDKDEMLALLAQAWGA